MIRQQFEFILAASATILLASAPTQTRADLFALGSSTGEIHRIDADTGDILDTYDIPSGYPQPSIQMSLAFDGRILYLSRNVNPNIPLVEIFDFHIPTKTWLQTSPPFPFDFPVDSLGGMGYLCRDDRETLIAVAGNTGGGMPLQVLEIELIDSMPVPIPFPPGPFFPPGLQGLALDVDPLTSELWMATRNVSSNAQSLIQFDLFGNVLVEFPLPASSFPTPIRGLGFDGGHMFLADISRNIYEVDRTNGSVLRSFDIPLPAMGLIGALTGGEIVPEPSSAVLLLLAACLASSTRKRPNRLRCR